MATHIGCVRKFFMGVKVDKGSNRVNRGGNWGNTAVNCRLANCNRNAPDNRNDNLGFRLSSPRRGPKGIVYGLCSCAQVLTMDLHPAPGSTRTKREKPLRLVGP
jgi:hypothetical protein